MRRTLILTALLVLTCGTLIGCGGSGERGKNKDFDRPRLPDSRK